MIDILTLSDRLFQTMMELLSQTRFEPSWTRTVPERGQKGTQGVDYIDQRRKVVKRQLVNNHLNAAYLPENSLSVVIDSTEFEKMLPGAPVELIKFISTEARRVFLTTLMSCTWSVAALMCVLERFRERKFTDKILPIENIAEQGKCYILDGVLDDSAPDCPHHPVLDVFHELWDDVSVEAFYTNQWKFIAPVFKKHNRGQFNRELPHKTVLPFPSKEIKGYSGHFSDVFEAKIRGDHQDTLIPDANNEVHIAIKELKNSIQNEGSYDPAVAWQREAETWNKIGALNHPHLIRHIASFKCDSAYSIMFEWANGGTLRDFWRGNPKAHIELTANRLGKFLEQLHGLASALYTLHKPGLAGGNSRRSHNSSFQNRNGKRSGTTNIPEISIQGGDTNWRHGDLKPENILVFKDSDSPWLGTLKIADLGLAKEHEFSTTFRGEATSTKHTTLHYEAPEAITHAGKPRSRVYDVWSIGCTILESIIWVLYGLPGLDEFHKGKGRLTPEIDGTLYFTVNRDGGNPVAKVSDRAELWMEEMLANHPELKRPTALRDLLLLVKDKLLVLQEYRADAECLHNEMNRIKEKAKGDNNYLFRSGETRPFEIPSSLYTADQTATKVDAVYPRGRLVAPRLLGNGPAQQVNLDENWDLQPDEICTRLMKARGHHALHDFPVGTSSLCQHCLTFDIRALGLVSRDGYSFLESRGKYCTLCNLLLRIINTSDTLHAEIMDRYEIWRVQGGLALNPGGIPILSIYRAASANNILNPQLQYDPIGIPRLATVPSQKYFDIIRQWLEDCDGNHVNCQLKASESSFITIPTRLISVEDKKSDTVRLLDRSQICEAQPIKYIALSHPWGDKDEHGHYYTTWQNIAHHRTGIAIDSLPKTFKDAIEVTRQLGLQYLWIDSLCIIQGEDSDFEEEAKHMETVFSSAYCVIAATCAKGMSSGFLNSRLGRKVVKVARPNETPFYICEYIDNFQRDVIEGALNRRGWVLQERALARRTIYFAENQTYWECGEGVRCETLMKMKNSQAALLGDPKFPKVAAGSSKGAQIRLYELLYKQYSRLQFTKIYDRPLAIAGIEQRLIRAFNTQGGYGIFTCYFGRCLLWQRDTTQIMKRIQFPLRQQYQIPSWSWMAYEGGIDFMNLPFGEVDWEDKEIRSPWNPLLASSSRLNITSNASWHTADTNGRNDLTAIARDFSVAADPYVVYDRGERPRDHIVKCAIVGRSKVTTGVNRIHYVLVIAQQADASPNAGYERIGVAKLPGNLITLEGEGIQVQVF